jgi:hypothetical protein
MDNNTRILERLAAFKERDKFSWQAWNDKGLNPSPAEVCNELSHFFNTCANKVIEGIKKNYSARQFKKLLKKEFRQLNKSAFDREEREFICQIMYELASIINIEINDTLNTWLYDPVLIFLMKLQRLLRPERIIKTLKQPCTKCGNELETHVLKFEEGIPEYSWYIGRCNNCSELNLISPCTGAKQTKFGNYVYVESLSKEEYTFEQALVRLEQIKFFRK